MPMTAPDPLVLLPGLLCDRALWSHQTTHLADLVETHVADLTGAESITGMAQQVLATAPDRFALAGLSMGGYCALEILRQAPGRVTRLALLDTTAQPDSPQQLSRRRGLIQLAEKGQFKDVTPRLLPLLIHPDRLDDAALTTTVMEMAARIGQPAFVRQQKAIMGRMDSRPHLPAITAPTLVLCGRQDALTPPERSAEMAEAIPDAQLEIIEECGHLSTLERPEATTEALRAWLAR